jgi:nucleotide-binding universal stress UspA family protein
VFSNVIVGVDGRPGGRDAIALARRLVAPHGALALAHVYPTHAMLGRAGRGAQEARGKSAAMLEREREAASADADLMSVPGASPGRGLHEAAERQRADLLVVGSTHRGPLTRVVLGDDTRAALDGAPCAVAIAPVGYAHDLRSIETIGVGHDGGPESEAALALARELADELNAGVRALRVVQLPSVAYGGFGAVGWGITLGSMVTDAEAQMHELEQVEGEAVLGVAGEELAAFGDRVQLLVVGSRGYGPVRRLMLGSTSQHLAGHSRCPLLVLPRTTGVSAPEAPQESASHQPA